MGEDVAALRSQRSIIGSGDGDMILSGGDDYFRIGNPQFRPIAARQLVYAEEMEIHESRAAEATNPWGL